MYRTKEELSHKLRTANEQCQQQHQQADNNHGGAGSRMSAYEFQTRLAQLIIEHDGMLCSIQVRCK
jgi:hypothetical protein